MKKTFLVWAWLLSAGAWGEEVKSYEQVITKEARTSRGIFLVHRVKDKLYYEIPQKELGRPFLMETQVAKTRLGAGFGGDLLDHRIVRWELRDQKVLLRSIAYDIVADPTKPIARAVKAANTDAILMSFAVDTYNSNDDPVIEVSKLFTTNVAEFSPKLFLKAKYFEASRSFLDRAKAYPLNIEVESTLTFSNPPDGIYNSPPASNTAVIHSSMVALPEKPMRPRIYDDRVGFFTVGSTDYSSPNQKVEQQRFICRWRLEKKNPLEAVSEPVKPIIFYVDPATPREWVPYVKKGVEEWQTAFEAAGFKNAIVARDAPQDPAWSAEDARYSVIRWLPSPIENAFGPNVSDPRSGEILEADIHVYHNITSLLRTWYFLQASPLDPRAYRLPLPESLMGDLIQFVVAHEVGHSLGFPHNFKASSTYPAAMVRNRDWVHKMGHCPSIMDYSRLNYVAQPEDKIPPADLIPHVGPYDCFATRWGYTPIPEAQSADDEQVTLDRWAREQDKTPWFRFSTPGMAGIDPGDQSEAVGDQDALYASHWGLKNLQRVARLLLSALGQQGENWADLTDMYERLLGQWTQEIYHVVVLVGGTHSRAKHGGQNGLLFSAVPRARQAAAVQFVLDNAMRAPAWLLDPQILRRIEPTGSLKRLQRYQQAILRNLLLPTRLARMLEQNELGPKSGYSAADLLLDVRQGMFRELLAPGPPHVEATRRGVQTIYLTTLSSLLAAEPTGDLRGLLLSELSSLRSQVQAALRRNPDRMTRAHLMSLQEGLREVLEPKPGTTLPKASLNWELRPGDDGCWSDLRIP